MYELMAFVDEISTEADLVLKDSRISLTERLANDEYARSINFFDTISKDIINITYKELSINDFSYSKHELALSLMKRQHTANPVVSIKDDILIHDIIKKYLCGDKDELIMRTGLLLEYLYNSFHTGNINQNMWNILPIMTTLYPQNVPYYGSFNLCKNRFFNRLVMLIKESFYSNVMAKNSIGHLTHKTLYECIDILRHDFFSSNHDKNIITGHMDYLYLIAFMSSAIVSVWSNCINITNNHLSKTTYQTLIHILFLFENSEE